MKNTILVIGASGTVGTELTQLLKAEGHTVRTATSKAAKDSSSVHLNLVTGEGLKNAFEGIDKVFLLSPPPFVQQDKLLVPVIHEAQRRGVKKIVLMTAMGADASNDTPFRKAELELEKSGLNYNIIRPNWFLQNFNTFWIQGIREHGKIFLPAGKAKTSFIDAKDISAVAAKLLTTDTFNNRAFNLTGPEAIDHDQVAKEISAVGGKNITYQEIAPADLKKGLLGAGLPEDYTDFLLLIMGFLREGYNAAVTTSVKDITGREPRSVKQYAQD